MTHVVGLDDLSRALGDLEQALVVAGLVLSLVCPPAAGAVWAAVAVVAVCQLAVDLTRRERGEHVGLSTLGMDALGALPMGRLAAGVHAVAEVRTAAEADAAINQLAPEFRQSRLVPGGGLTAHEGTATYRGHTLLKHVGKTQQELLDRFKTEPHLQWSSSFTDRATAEAATARRLDDHRKAISRWLAGTDEALDPQSQDFGSRDWQIGGQRMGLSSQHRDTVVVLRKENTMLGYYIRTAFPEAMTRYPTSLAVLRRLPESGLAAMSTPDEWAALDDYLREQSGRGARLSAAKPKPCSTSTFQRTSCVGCSSTILVARTLAEVDGWKYRDWLKALSDHAAKAIGHPQAS